MFIHLCFGAFISAQITVRNYDPAAIRTVDLSTSTEKEINRQNELLSRKYLTALEKKELDLLLKKYGEIVESVWDVIDGGCSWYCAGGNYKVTASSSLQKQNSINYDAISANDLSYRTAWVEGKRGSGVGEFLQYFFRNGS